jgi:membrane protein
MLNKLKQAFTDFSEDEILTRASSLAYYSALAMAPLMVLLVWILSIISPELQTALVENVQSLVGQEGGRVIAAVISGAEKRPDLSSFSGWIGFAGLLFSASVIFGQLQSTLNLVFDAEVKQTEKQTLFQSVKVLLFSRLFSIGMLMTFVFIATVSLLLSSVMAYLFRGVESGLLQAVIMAGNFVIFSILFALIFKAMPDRKIDYKAAFIGGAITSILFAVGKMGISYYLARASVGSAYGAAGSFAVLLVWLYYSAVIFYLGAEIAFALLIEKSSEERSRKAVSNRRPSRISSTALQS